MRIQKFLAPTFRDALAQVKDEMGSEAMIIATKQVRRGMLGNGVEVTAATEIDEPETPPPAPTHLQVAPPLPPAGLSDADVERVMAPLRSELRALRSSMRAITETPPPDNGVKAEIAALRKLLMEVRQAQNVPKPEPPPSLEEVAARSTLVAPSTARAVILVGPTGAGKTTTVAKLAAREALVEGKNVAILTLDGYRVGGEAQLRTFADLIGVPLTVAANPQQLRKLLTDLSLFDRLYIDTAGRCCRDKAAIEELLPALNSREDLEVHLVLPVNVGAAQLDAYYRRYQTLAPDRLLFTKTDEAEDLGELVRAPARLNCPVSHVCTGQRVPEDIEAATTERLVALASQKPAEPQDS